MLFNSLTYLLFLPAVVAAYYLCPVRFRIWLLLVASYVFYGSWNPWYLILIVGLTVANYVFGLLIAACRDRSRASLVLAAGIALNLGVLCFFKYSIFLLSNLAGAGRMVGLKTAPPQFSVILPLG